MAEQNPIELTEIIRALEESLTLPDVRKSAGRVSELLAEECVEFGSS